MRGLSQSRLDCTGYSPMEILWNARDVFIGNGGMVPKLEGHLTPIIHESFCCNRRSAATTSLSAGGLAPLTLTVLHEYASGPHGSARRSRDAAQRFRDEPS